MLSFREHMHSFNSSPFQDEVSLKMKHACTLLINGWLIDTDVVSNCFFYITEFKTLYEPQHEISNNVVCATSKASDQPAHMCSLIRDFASPLNIL